MQEAALPIVAMRTCPRRVPWLARMGALLLALAGSAACSHLAPYRDLRAASPPAAEADRVEIRLLLVGDAGEADEALLAAVRDWVGAMPTRTLVAFLGDNAYPEGLVERRRGDAERRLERLLAVVEDTPATALFVPGNHDWADGGADGLTAVDAQAAFLRGRARFLPDAGCPGPALLDLPAGRPRVRLVALDTQWWLHDWPTRDACVPGTRDGVLEALTRALDTDLPVVIAAHHPPASHGLHGGFFDWRAHLFPFTGLHRRLWLPLPGVGSIYPLVRRLSAPDQDLGSPEYREMRAALTATLAARTRRRPLLYAAGHEHSLQLLRGEAVDYVLVSGAGSRAKLTAVSHGPDTLFAHEHPGFMLVDITDASIRMAVVEPLGGGGTVVAFELGVPLAGVDGVPGDG